MYSKERSLQFRNDRTYDWKDSFTFKTDVLGDFWNQKKIFLEYNEDQKPALIGRTGPDKGAATISDESGDEIVSALGRIGNADLIRNYHYFP